LRLGACEARPGAPTGCIEIADGLNCSRVLFCTRRRWVVGEDLLVVATLANTGYPGGYRLTGTSLPDGRWRELLNTDAGAYGGGGVGNPSELNSAGGSIAPRLPANGVLVLQRQ
jgi:1,4-alpha-glucan branching enzyme